MPIPDYQSLMRPLLEAVSDGQAVHIREVSKRVAQALQLTEEDLGEILPSGKQAVYANRLGWAKTYLAKAGVLSSEGRGIIRLTERGRELLQRVAGRITQADLQQYEEFRAFTSYRQPTTGQPSVSVSKEEAAAVATESPEERLSSLYAELTANLAEDVLEQIKSITPAQFERLVVEVLVAMGYGGNVRDAGQALGRSGDNGIDGLIKQDPLGLDRIYLQAKRWQNTVHSPEIRTFSGSLTYHKATKGVFITTSTFSDGAKATAEQIGNIILLDGEQLARLMIDYGVGVLTRETYQIRRVDAEYFEEL